MRKIIGVIHPFDIYQNFYVYQDGNKIEMTQAKLNDIPETVLELAQLYDVYRVDLSGAKHYAQKIIREIQEKEFTKYNENKLVIKCI